MTEQLAIPPEPTPARSMPRLGRGINWSAHPDFDGPVPPAEPYQPKPRARPAGGWPKTGTLGASAQLADDEQPATVPARPYDQEFQRLREEGVDMVAEIFDFPRELIAPTNAQPGGILRVGKELTGEELERLRADWLCAVDAKPVLSHWTTVRAAGGVLGPLPVPGHRNGCQHGPVAGTTCPGCAEIDAQATSTEHQHIWSATSPMRCVECRRYLRPWWRRLRDRLPLRFR